jgi:Fe-S cluster biogenesis protein NfuA
MAETLPSGIDRIEELVTRLEGASDEKLRSDALALVQLLLDLHREGLGRILEIAARSGASFQNGKSKSALLERLAADDAVAPLLMLHDMHPVDLSVRVGQALEKVRPLLRSHGGDVELVELTDRVVKLKLEGSCHGCPSSSQTLRNAIEEAIFEFAPDVERLEVSGVVEQPPPASGFVPLEAIRAH